MADPFGPGRGTGPGRLAGCKPCNRVVPIAELMVSKGRGTIVELVLVPCVRVGYKPPLT